MKAARLLLPILLLGLLLPAGAGEDPGRPPRVPSLPYKSKRRLGELFKSYFGAKEEERAAILVEVAGFDPIPPSAVKGFRKDLFKLARKGLRLDGKNRARFAHPDYPGNYILSGGSGNKEKGLFVGLHGGGQGSGDGAIAAQKWQSAQGQGCVCIFPTVIEKLSSAWNKEREERYVLELIEAAKRTFRIDTNRIYLAGHSMGGYGTWSIGPHHADLFAALSPNGGGIFLQVGADRKIVGHAPGLLPNLHNTPIYFTHGDDDKQVSVEPDRHAARILADLKKLHPTGYDFTYKEYEGIGHGLPPGGTMPIIKWLTSHRRDPLPEKIIWEPVVPFKKSFYWLRKTASGGGEVVAERKGNLFTITAKGKPTGLSLLLNKELVDFKKPVTVMVNGEEVFKGFVQHSAAVLLETIAGRNDPHLYFTARWDLE